MRIQFVKPALFGQRSYPAGEVVDAPEDVAKRLKDEGAAVDAAPNGPPEPEKKPAKKTAKDPTPTGN